MKDITNNIEIKSLNILENLSKQISDSIYSGDYSNIEDLNFKRIQIIKIFENTSDNNIRVKLRNILVNNKENIKEIEDKKRAMELKHSKFIKRFKAYNI
jgi:hypothetical protein